MSESASRPGRLLRVLVPALLIMLVAANGILGYAVWDTRKELDRERSAQAAVGGVATRVANLEAAVNGANQLGQRSSSGLGQRIENLERSLYGSFGPPSFKSDSIGDLDRRVRDLESCTQDLAQALHGLYGQYVSC